MKVIADSLPSWLFYVNIQLNQMFMSREEATEILNTLSPEELTVFIYKYVLGLSVHTTAKIRRQRKPAYIYLSNQVDRKVTNYDKHQQAIAGLQELFEHCQPDSFLISKSDML